VKPSTWTGERKKGGESYLRLQPELQRYRGNSGQVKSGKTFSGKAGVFFFFFFFLTIQTILYVPFAIYRFNSYT